MSDPSKDGMKVVQITVFVTVPEDTDEEDVVDAVTEALNEAEIMAYIELAE